MQSNKILINNASDTEKKHYELLVPLQFASDMQEQLGQLDILIIERTGSKNLEKPIGPKLIDSIGSSYLIYCTPEQAKKAVTLPFVESIQPYIPPYPREEIKFLLDMNIALRIEFFCTISNMLKQHLQKYMASTKKAFYDDSRGLNNLGLFSFKVNKPEDLNTIDEIAKIAEIRAIEYSTSPALLKS